MYSFYLRSGTVNAEVIDDLTGNLGKGRWIFAMSPSTTKTPRIQCYEWFVTASTIAGSRRLQCPLSGLQAFVDRRFRRQDIFGRICYVRRNPRNGIGLRCCYRRFAGPLLTNTGEPGGLLSANPLHFSVQDDDDAYENCCVLSNLCSAYVRRRPKQDGRLYRPRGRRRGNSGGYQGRTLTMYNLKPKAIKNIVTQRLFLRFAWHIFLFIWDFANLIISSFYSKYFWFITRSTVAKPFMFLYIFYPLTVSGSFFERYTCYTQCIIGSVLKLRK